MKLTSKILGLLLVVVVSVTMVAGWLSTNAAYVELERRQQALARELAGEMQERLAEAWHRGGPRAASLALSQWAYEYDQPISVHLVFFREDADVDHRPQAPRSAWSASRLGQIFSVVGHDKQGNRRLHTYLPLIGLGGEIGALEFTQPLSALDEQTRNVVRGTLVSIFATALIGLVLAYAAGVRWVARPLQALIDHTTRIGQGDFTHKLQLHGGDELDQLARALNLMSDRISEQQTAIALETERRMATLQQLRHVDRLGTLGRMAAGIAHELGTPLNVVAGRAALIASGKLSANEITESARTIKSEADRITNIVQRLLEFARGRKPQRKACDLVAIISRTISLLKPMAEKRNVQLEFTRPQQGTVALIDDSQIQQVLTNLIVNGIHATQPGGRVRVQIEDVDQRGESKQAEPWLRVRVDDDGSGIPTELRERIFEPFFTTKEVGEGTGLGLSIAYGIVQEHGGDLSVTDSELGGVAFDIWLPQSQA